MNQEVLGNILTGSLSDKEKYDDSVDNIRHTGNGRFTKK